MSAITDVKRPIEGLTVTQLNQEIKDRWDKSNAILTDCETRGGATEEALGQVKELRGEIDQFEAAKARQMTLAEYKADTLKGLQAYSRPAEQMRHSEPQQDRVIEQRAGRHKGYGQQFLDSEQYRALDKIGLKSVQWNPPEFTVRMEGPSFLERRALLQGGSDTSGGAFVTPDYRPGYLELFNAPLSLLDIISRGTTESDLVSYMKEDSFTNNAAFTAEATATTGTSGTKPESALAFSAQTSAVKTLAHWLPVTNRMLADAPRIRGIIDNRLLVGLDRVLEQQIITGDGQGENLTGVTNAGIQALAYSGFANQMDAIYRMMVMVQITGQTMPTAIAMNPLDFEPIRLARENASTAMLGGYLMGPPSAIGANTLWGRPIVEVQRLTEGTVVVGDWSAIGAELIDREEATIRVGYIDAQFVRNMQSILAELRCTFIVYRPTAFVKMSGV